MTEITDNRNHNWLADAAQTIHERTAKAQEGTFETLMTFVAIGEVLNEVKETLGGAGRNSTFGKWCDEQGFSFDKTWRSRLMKLAANWDEAKAAMEVRPEGERKWSVKEVLKALADKRKADSGLNSCPEATISTEAKPKPPSTKERLEQVLEENKRLSQALTEALERIKSFEARKAPDQTQKPSQPKLDFGAQRYPALHETLLGNQEAANAQNSSVKVDPQDRTRAKKVWALYTRGVTAGEREAAKERLERSAEKYGLPFDDFIAACGIAR